MPWIPELVAEAWDAYGAPQEILDVEETSALVSTNRVYRVHLADGSNVFAKVSSYGSFVHFRQDHQRIHSFCEGLLGTRFEGLLADVLCRDGEAFTHRLGRTWVAFYREVPIRESLPKILSEAQIRSLGSEVAHFHDASERVGQQLAPTWKTLGSDIAQLWELLERDDWCGERGMGRVDADFVRRHCDAFLTNADRLGYARWARAPVLVDWNIGNFSVVPAEDGAFRLFSRWDYDWLRFEPCVLDFYFMSRVVSSVGDRTLFTYDIAPLLEERFLIFLRSYHAVRPLELEHLLFLKEAYRFFLLNYVVREGEHFFREEYCARLRREVTSQHLESISEASLEPLVRALLG